MNRERVTHKAAATLLEPAAVSSTTASGYVDLQGFDAAEVVVNHGDVTAAAGDNSLDLTLQAAADGATPGTAGEYTTVPAADLVGAFTALENGVTAGVQRVAYIGTGRYLRAVATLTGTASATLGAVALLELSDREPANTKTPAAGSIS